MTEVEIVRRLRAQLELDYRIPMKIDSAVYVLRAIAPHVVAIVREEVNEARRRWDARECQK